MAVVAKPRPIRVVPATADRWSDIEDLFGARGACGGCWCMTPRLSRAQYESQKGEGNRRALRQLVTAGREPGVLGYLGNAAIGWCAIEPRASFTSLARSRVLAPVDDREVWSIVCLFVSREHRGRGVSRALIAGAVAHARRNGAKTVEAYPIDPGKPDVPPVFAYTGLLTAYLNEGFCEVERRSETRPIVRIDLEPARRRRA